MDDSVSVMRRKAGAGRPLPEIGAPTATRILRTALMQAGDDVAGLSIVANIPEEQRVTLKPLVEGIGDHALMALIEGPKGAQGLVVLDPQAMAALIEVQTTGRVAPRAAIARMPTRTDAIMCADFIDRTLELLEARATEAKIDLAPVVCGYRFAAALPDPRAITMTFADIAYRKFTVGLDLARGAKQGQIDVILPFEVSETGQTGGPGMDPDRFSDALAQVVQDTTARLAGTLHRVDMALSEVAALEIGSQILIPASALTEVAVEDIEGRLVLRGRLGMQNGQRAIRVGSAKGAQDTAPRADRAPILSPPNDATPDVAMPDPFGPGDLDPSNPVNPGD